MTTGRIVPWRVETRLSGCLHSARWVEPATTGAPSGCKCSSESGANQAGTGGEYERNRHRPSPAGSVGLGLASNIVETHPRRTASGFSWLTRRNHDIQNRR